MGTPKHRLVRSDGQSLLAFQVERLAPHFSQVLLLTGGFSVDPGLPGRCLPDPVEFQGEGPLAGLLAAMQVAEHPWVALLAIDQPAFPAGHYQRALSKASPDDQAVLFRDDRERLQWLCGLYRSNLRGELEARMSEGLRAVKDFGAGLKLRIIESKEEGVFQNLNTPSDAAENGWLLPDG